MPTAGKLILLGLSVVQDSLVKVAHIFLDLPRDCDETICVVPQGGWKIETMNGKNEREKIAGIHSEPGSDPQPSSFAEADPLIQALLSRVFELAPRLGGRRWSAELSEFRAEAGQQLAAQAALRSASCSQGPG